MQDLVRAAMRDGCFGLSTGLVYPPGAYADTEEVVELARVVGEAGGLYASHIRGEGHSLLRAVAEAIEIGERAGRPGPDLAPQGGVPALLGPDPPRDAPVRVGPGARAGRHVRRLSLHGGQRAADPDRARLGSRRRAGRASRAGPRAGQPGAPRAGDRRAGPRVGPDPRGLDAARAGQGRRGIVDRRHRRPPRDRSRRDAVRAPGRVGRAGDHGPLRHERGRRPPRDAASPRDVRLGRLGAHAAGAAGRRQAASSVLRHLSADPRSLRAGRPGSSRSRRPSTRRPTGRPRSSAWRPRAGSRWAPTRTSSSSIRPPSEISPRTPTRTPFRRASSTCSSRGDDGPGRAAYRRARRPRASAPLRRRGRLRPGSGPFRTRPEGLRGGAG